MVTRPPSFFVLFGLREIPLLDQLLRSLGEILVVDDNVVPLGPVHSFAGLVDVNLVGGQWKEGHARLAFVVGLGLRISSDVAQQDNFVDATGGGHELFCACVRQNAHPIPFLGIVQKDSRVPSTSERNARA